MKAVKFDSYGDVNVLYLAEVPIPEPATGEVAVRIKAAGINPGENSIRSGALENVYPTTFPCGEGTDFAGVVSAVGDGVSDVTIGDEVAGFTDNRASHAEFVVVPTDHVSPKPAHVSWEIAGSLEVAGVTAYAAVEAVGIGKGDSVVITAAAGGVGSIAVQLAVAKGARVFAVAGAHDAEWLTGLGATPIDYDGDVASAIKDAVGTPDAFIDASGKGYVKMAIELGVAPNRIDTIIDFGAAQEYGTKADGASAIADPKAVMIGLLQKINDGELEVPIAKTFALDDVKEAYGFLATSHHRGKVVLKPNFQ